MLKIAILAVEDEDGPEIYRQIHQGLEEWLFVRKGLVELSEPPDQELRWATHLAGCRRAVERLVVDHDLVFCTVDLSIPKDAGGQPDPRHGLAVVHEIAASGKDSLRCCVLTGLSSSEIEKRFGNSVPEHVLFDFKVATGTPHAYRNVINNIKSQVLALMSTLTFIDSQDLKRSVILSTSATSERSRDHYLSKAPYYVDQSTWHVPTLVLGAPGLGRRTFVEFVAHLAEARVERIDLAPASFADNRRCFKALGRLAEEMEKATAGAARRQLCYIANLDSYEPGVSGADTENCLEPLRRILDRIAALGSTQKEGFPHGFAFSVSGASRLRIRDAETRSIIQVLEDVIGVTTDLPLHHLASDINGWPIDHPRIVTLPKFKQCDRGFKHEIARRKLESLRETLPDHVPGYQGQMLSLADDVFDFLVEKMKWDEHGNFGGMMAEFDRAFEHFLEKRSEDQYQITRAHLDASLRKILGGHILSADDVALEFDDEKTRKVTRVVERADFHVEEGELLAIVGPSGCGKSSILKLLAGLTAPTEGVVKYGEKRITGPTSKVGFVFQDYSLFPWLDVRGNIEFGPRLRGEERGATAARIDKLLEVAQLTPDDERKWPRQLSGGMQQRVAILRALANEPEVLLMDEPFAALDVQTRWRMQDFLISTKEMTKKTIVFVTHDIDEAVYIADRIYVATPRPMTIRDEVIVPFAAAVRHDELRTDPVFVALVNRVRETLLFH